MRGIAFHPSAQFMVSCSDDKTVRTWDLKTGRCIKVIPDAHDQFVTCVAYSRDGGMLASGGMDSVAKIWV